MGFSINCAKISATFLCVKVLKKFQHEKPIKFSTSIALAGEADICMIFKLKFSANFQQIFFGKNC